MPSAIAIAAHPDDIEFLMAGTLLRLKQAGYAIHYFNLADGCCGSTVTDRETTARIRLEEAKAAAALLGATHYPPICHDLEIFYEKPLLAKVAAVIRAAQPEIVLTHAPSDYMEDHQNACRLAVTAAFTRGMPNFVTDPSRPVSEVKITVYHAQPYGNCDPLRQPVRPEIFVDVGEVVEMKVASLAAHASQKRWLDESQGLDSYLEALRQADRVVGKLSGKFEFAEGWRRHLHLGFCGPNDDPLRKALERWIAT
jgi:LmbE family N-acetylglucosaminyl deacetylase